MIEIPEIAVGIIIGTYFIIFGYIFVKIVNWRIEGRLPQRVGENQRKDKIDRMSLELNVETAYFTALALIFTLTVFIASTTTVTLSWKILAIIPLGFLCLLLIANFLRRNKAIDELFNE